MKVTRNPVTEQRIMEQIKASFATQDVERNATLHMSDFSKPRQAFWQRVMPLPPTSRECLYFLAGRGHEDAFGRIAGMEPAEERIFFGISYRPDFRLHRIVPGEFKTRRSNLAEPGAELVEYSNYLDQLGNYCAADESLYGMLIVLSLLEGRSRDVMKPTEPVLAVYDAIFTEEELEARRELLGARKVLLVAALAAVAEGADPQETVKPLPLCADWMCGKQRKIVDKQAYCNACQKEINHKPEHAHIQAGQVTPETFHWEYEARCKWYSNCQPWLVDPTRGAR